MWMTVEIENKIVGMIDNKQEQTIHYIHIPI